MASRPDKVHRDTAVEWKQHQRHRVTLKCRKLGAVEPQHRLGARRVSFLTGELFYQNDIQHVRLPRAAQLVAQTAGDVETDMRMLAAKLRQQRGSCRQLNLRERQDVLRRHATDRSERHALRR